MCKFKTQRKAIVGIIIGIREFAGYLYVAHPNSKFQSVETLSQPLFIVKDICFVFVISTYGFGICIKEKVSFRKWAEIFFYY